MRVGILIKHLKKFSQTAPVILVSKNGESCVQVDDIALIVANGPCVQLTGSSLTQMLGPKKVRSK